MATSIWLSGLLIFLASGARGGTSKVPCHSGLTGDYEYQTCGTFCKEVKAKNHCRFCKCKTCEFCAATQPSPHLALPTAITVPTAKESASQSTTNTKTKHKSRKASAGQSEAAATASGNVKTLSTTSPAVSSTSVPPAGEIKSSAVSAEAVKKSWDSLPTVLLLLGVCCAASLIWMSKARKHGVNYEDIERSSRVQGRRLVDEAIHDVEKLEASRS
mmetsp:Transcript_76/g.302  ORF Transcript_76/g.302 Transcript_76/m.302 type:complete len:216 (+) Transcript_76:37-684(+)|eukprot:scaffold195778_cov31-Tisochrysis_lutea.AAC.1